MNPRGREPRLGVRHWSDVTDDAAFIWDRPTPQPPPRRSPETPPEESGDGRITLREAEHRFGVRVSTLRAWSRRGSIDAVRAKGPHGEQWMVTPESVAHHLSRRSPRKADAPPSRSAGPTDDGSSMLVPRDAWDKLMDQLGNLHEAGLQLASARERAAKAETEATFLRERLAEMRTERDESRSRDVAEPPPSAPAGDHRTLSTRWWIRLKDRLGRTG